MENPPIVRLGAANDPVFGESYVAISTSYLWSHFLCRIGEKLHLKMKADKTKLPVSACVFYPNFLINIYLSSPYLSPS
jgi:hypothetical protein